MIQGISLARVAGMYAMEGSHNPVNARHWHGRSPCHLPIPFTGSIAAVAPVRLIAYNAMVHCTNARFFTRLS
jgi:hypothetical protein